jgi:foldase protein PrsA
MMFSVAVAGAGLSGIAACGGDEGSSDVVPSNGVAKIGDVVVKKSEFDKTFKLVALSPFLKGQAFVANPPNPPSFSNCVAAKKTVATAKERPTVSGAHLRKTCAREYGQLKRETMQTLIETEWLRQEAAERNISVSNGEAERNFEEQKAAGFPNEAAYRAFLRNAGMSEDDFRSRIRLNQLQEKLEKAIKRDVSSPSAGDIRAYYEENKKSFVRPESREFRFVITKTKADGEEAKRAVDNGLSWAVAMKRYSTDPDHSNARISDGSLLDQGFRALERDVFQSAEGEIGGPVKARPGWYVFEVTQVRRAGPQPLGEAKPRIVEALRDRRGKAGVDKFREEYRKETVCADEFKAPQCSNAPTEGSS